MKARSKHPWRQWSGRVPEEQWSEFEKRKEAFLKANPKNNWEQYNKTLNAIAKELNGKL